MQILRKVASSARSWFYSPEQNFSEQFLYGGIDIIREYYGIEENRCLRAFLQHGWVYGDPTVYRPNAYVRGRLAPDFIWSERVLHELTSVGKKEKYLIGSPWAHVVSLALEKKDPIANENSLNNSLLYMPAHTYVGWEFKVEPKLTNITLGRHRKYACLHWLDFINPTTRRLFIDSGYELTCAGYSGSSEVPWTDNGGRKNFLKELFNLFKVHKLIVVDDISTPFWYALSIGKSVLINQSSMQYKYWSSQSRRTVHKQINTSDVSGLLGIQPFPINEVINPDEFLISLARRELGFEYVGNGRKFFEDERFSFNSNVQ